MRLSGFAQHSLPCTMWLGLGVMGCGGAGTGEQPGATARQNFDGVAGAAGAEPRGGDDSGQRVAGPEEGASGDARDAGVAIPADAGGETGTPDEPLPELDAAAPNAHCQATATPASVLSATGCFTADGRASDALVPYELNAPLWSDGADKRRWLSLPAGAQLEVAADGDLAFPEGSVFAKEFSLGEQRLETRLLMKVAEQWVGVSYAWDEGGNDAHLLDDTATLDFAAQPWRVPSPAQCFECHTDVAGVSLGLTLGQLDREVTDPDTGVRANQLETWQAHGWLAQLPAEWPAMVDLQDQAIPVAQRARAYLASNCSACHRSGGPGLGPMDLRIERTMSDMGICDAPALGGNLGVEGAKLLLPGAPERSMVWVRMQNDEPWKMPPLGTSVVDSTGSALLAEWIRSLEGCP